MKQWLFICAVLLTLTGVSRAGSDGGTESVFSLGAGARAMGMGNGFTAIADDATAVYYNPAGMPYLARQQISALHTILFESTIYDYISYVYPDSSLGGFGIAAMRFGIDDIGRRDEFTDLGTFSATQFQLLLSYGRPLAYGVSTGLSLKLAHHAIDDNADYGFGLDWGLMYRPVEQFRVGFIFQDVIGARLKLVSNKERTPFTVRGGAAYFLEPKHSDFSATAAVDVEKPENRTVQIRTGIEARHRSGLAIRGGYDRDNFTVGAGVTYHDLSFDYAYKFIDDLEDSHRLSVTFGFGKSQEERAAEKAEAASAAGQRLLEESRREAFEQELSRADAYYNGGQYDSALASYYRAQAFEKDNTYVKTRVEELSRRLSETWGGQPVVILPDSISEDFVHNFGLQARELYHRGSLRAALDLVEMARRFSGDTDALLNLEDSIQSAVDLNVEQKMRQGDASAQNGDFISAYENYSQILQLDEENGEALSKLLDVEKKLNLAQHINLALDYFNSGKYISARREFRTVQRIDPNNKTAREYLGRIEGLVKESTTLDDLQKDERVWQLYLDGLEQFRLGNYEQAIDLWEDVLEVYPNNRNTLENIEQAKLRLNQK